MKEAFNKYVRKEKLFSKKDKVLVAVSGGVDSVIMLHLLMDSGYKTAVAHCNFDLRGKESDADEKFVRSLAKKNNLPFYSVNFDTEKIAQKQGISIQMAARNLRFEWLEKMRKQNEFDVIAVAHHSDDSTETFFINLIRGTGISGLHGIRAKSGRVVRPLLFASRKEIEQYAQRNNIKYREDSSNHSDKYLRNKIRHHLIPLLKEMNPSVDNAINSAMGKLNGIEAIFHDTVEEAAKKIVRKQNSVVSLDISLLSKLPHPGLYLFEFVKPYGFSGDVVGKMISAINAESGRVFYSSTHRLIRDRKHFLITSINRYSGNAFYSITEKMKSLKSPVHLTFSLAQNDKKFIMPNTPDVAALDYDRLKFPLLLRKWKTGDFFHPFGMKGKKKLSDFYTDKKLSVIEKESAWLLCSAEDIVWVVGHRIDNNYRVTARTKKIYKVSTIV